MSTDSIDQHEQWDSGRIDVLSRAEFLECFAQEYGSGQHVTLLGPTQRGKTTLCHQMLSVVISPERKCLILAGKPPHRDPVMAEVAKGLNLQVVEEWPPTDYEKYRARKKNGYVLRPRQTMTDLAADEDNLRKQFGKGIISNYRAAKPSITVVDEAHLVHNEYRLKKHCEAPLMRGAPHNGIWHLIQRGRYISYLAYDACEWILIAYDPDVSNQKRYAEIGGVDPRYLNVILPRLRTSRGRDGRSTVSEFLCIRRSGPEMFIVDTA